MIDPAFLDELTRFRSALNRESTALHRGEQDSPRVGEGLTFSDYRRYVPGDDTRLIDWKLYARTEEYFVKQFEEDRNLTVHVLVDASGSMDFGEGAHHKFEYGAKLGLGFASLSAASGNDFAFSIFGETPDRLDGGRSTHGEVLALVERLNRTEPAGQVHFADALADYAGQIRTRSLVIVVSDFLAEPDEVASGMAALARHDVLAARVLAPAERDPEPVGDVRLVDPESETTRRTYLGARRVGRYRDRLQRHVDEVRGQLEGLGVEHATIDTGADFFDSFASLWFE